MNKIVLLDFCGTVAKFQTFNPFIKYILKNEYPTRHKLATNRFICWFFTLIQLLLSFFKFKGYVYKYFIVWLLRGLDEVKFNKLGKEFYENILKDSLILETINLIKEKIRDKAQIIIVSGGCDEYIKHFAMEMGITEVIATKLEIIDGKLTGKFDGLDCMGENKVILLKQYLKEKNIYGELDTCITDSISDLPIMKVCRKSIIISKHRHQNWLDKGMDEIIWE